MQISTRNHIPTCLTRRSSHALPRSLSRQQRCPWPWWFAQSTDVQFHTTFSNTCLIHSWAGRDWGPHPTSWYPKWGPEGRISSSLQETRNSTVPVTANTWHSQQKAGCSFWKLSIMAIVDFIFSYSGLGMSRLTMSVESYSPLGGPVCDYGNDPAPLDGHQHQHRRWSTQDLHCCL